MAKGKRQKANSSGRAGAQAAGSKKAERALERVACAVPALLVAALAVFQGGYYAGATCVVGIVAAALLAVFVVVSKAAGLGMWPGAASSARSLARPSAQPGTRPDAPSRAPAAAATVSALLPSTAYCLMGLVYLVSALVRGATATMLLETATWFAVAGMALWCAFGCESTRTRARMLDDLAYVGVVLAAAGILMFAGVLPVEGAVNAGRLMFTFQYANTAGLYFGVVAVLCLSSGSVPLRVASAVPLVALVMTQSAGALAVSALGALAVGIRHVLVARPDKRLVAGAAAALVAACATGGVLLQARFAQAAQTFVERIVQMLDAAHVLGGNLALGIGPDCWQYTYPLVQTAQYRAADVHCSYLQIALDGGVLALALVVALFALSTWGLVRRVGKRSSADGGSDSSARAYGFAAVVCVLMIAVHALFDFDLQFSVVAVVLAAFVSAPSASPARGGQEAIGDADAFSAGVRPVSGTVFAAIATLALAGSVGGVWLDTHVGEVQTACYQGRAAQAANAVAGDPLLAGDPSVRAQVAGALFAAGDYQGALEATRDGDCGLASIGLYRAVSLCELGKDGAAVASAANGAASTSSTANESSAAASNASVADAFAQLLDEFPYDPDLYDAVRSYIVGRGLGGEFVQVYNRAAAHANDLAVSGHAAWLSNQVQVELIA